MKEGTLGMVLPTIGIAAIVGGLAWVLWFSLATDEMMLRVEGVHTKYVVYATAEYSETTSGYDIDGDYYSDTSTWSEEASEKIIWLTFDGEPSNVRVPDPKLYRDIDRGYDFDGINWHRSQVYTLKAENKGTSDTYDLTKEEYEKILNRTSDILRAEVNGWGMIRKLK